MRAVELGKRKGIIADKKGTYEVTEIKKGKRKERKRARNLTKTKWKSKEKGWIIVVRKIKSSFKV